MIAEIPRRHEEKKMENLTFSWYNEGKERNTPY